MITQKMSFHLEKLLKYFNDSQVKAYEKNSTVDLNDTELELLAKATFEEFLLEPDAFMKDSNPYDNYFKEWEEVHSIKGPFSNIPDADKAMETLCNEGSFKAQLIFNSIFDARDHGDEAKQQFISVMVSEETKVVKLYYTGDEDIISGICVLSYHITGKIYFVTFITD